MSSTADGVGLVAVGNSNGLIVVFDLTKHLMLWETWSFHIDEERINHGLTLPSQQYESDEQWEKLKQNIGQRKQQQENLTEQEPSKKQEEKGNKDNTEEVKEVQKLEEIKAQLLHKEDKKSELEQQGQQDDWGHKAAEENDTKVILPPSSQQGLPVSSCKLHSLGIVQSTREGGSEDSSISNNNRKDADSSNIDPSLLIGVSFSRSSGVRDAAIIVCDIHTNPSWKSVAAAAKKNKSKSVTLSSAAIEIPIGDMLLDIDESMPPPLPITMDIDSPTWELVPPLPPEPSLMSSNIPPPPPPPPLKNSSSAHKTEKGSQLQIFVVSEYIDNLPNDAHPVVSVIQPCGYSRVAVALEYSPTHGGCIILFNLEHCVNKTILGKSVMFEFDAPDLQVSHMCAMENLETGRTNSDYYLATVNKHGSFIVFSMEMNMVVTMSVGNDPLVSCFPCVNVGLFGMVTRSGVVKTVKVVGGKPVAEVNVLASNVVDGDTTEDEAILVSPHKGQYQAAQCSYFINYKSLWD